MASISSRVFDSVSRLTRFIEEVSGILVDTPQQSDMVWKFESRGH